MDISGIIISDRNAASSYAKFLTKEEGITSLNKDQVFARYWTHDNPFDQMEHASIKCAEVLVPDRVPSELITGVYVANEAAQKSFLLLKIPLSVTINSGIFF